MSPHKLQISLTKKIVLAVSCCLLLNFILIVGVTAYRTEVQSSGFYRQEIDRTANFVTAMLSQAQRDNSVSLQETVKITLQEISADDYHIEMLNYDELSQSRFVASEIYATAKTTSYVLDSEFIAHVDGNRYYTGLVPMETISLNAYAASATGEAAILYQEGSYSHVYPVQGLASATESRMPLQVTVSGDTDAALPRHDEHVAAITAQAGFQPSDSVLLVSKQLPGLSEQALGIIRNSFLIMLLVSVPTIGFLTLLIRRFTKPIIAMSIAAEGFADEQFDVSLPVDSSDEIGQLANSLNHMAKQLKENHLSREAFLASVSHELRTPLTTLKANTQGILDGIITTEELPEYLDSNMEEIDRLNLMVNELIMASSLEQNHDLHKEPLIVADLVQSVTQQMRLHAEKLGVNLSCSLDVDIQAFLDKAKMRQVLINLIENAIRHSTADGTVTLSCQTCPEQGHRFLLRICDQGCGLSEDARQRIFDRFYRDGNSTGLGLGLYISRQIVQAHGGDITASNCPEGGACFDIVLPCL